LAKLAESDPAFGVDDEEVSDEIIVRATSELHLTMICMRLAKEHNIRVTCSDPEPVYLETVRGTSVAEGKFITQSGGRGHYAHVVIRVEPNPTKGYKFVDETPKGAIPKKFLVPIDRGVRYALKGGAVAGYEIIDARVTLCDGSYHEGDSDDAAFESAGFMATKEALTQASPVLLEPLMSLEFEVPPEFCGVVMDDLTLRRCRIEGMEHRGDSQAIRAVVPMAEIMGYLNYLSYSTHRVFYSERFLRYEEAPGPPGADDDGIVVTANKPWKPPQNHPTRVLTVKKS
jgi:elongation factor G